MIKQSAALGAALMLLTGCMGGPSATQSVTKAPEQKGGLFGLAKSDDIKVTTGEAFKGANEVIIGGFIVGFDLSKTDSVKAGGGLMGSGFGGKSTAHTSLSGVDSTVMQKITEKAYADFVATLKAQGYTVIDRAELVNDADFAKTQTYPNPHEEKQGGLFGGGSVTKYFTPASFGAIRPFMGDIPGVTGGFGFSNPSMGAAGFAEKHGRKIIHVAYNVDYANADTYGGWHTKSSSIAVGQGLTIVPDQTRIGIIGGQSGTFSTNIGNVTLGQPIMSEKTFAEVSDATGDGAKAVEMAANVIGVLGGVGSNSSRTYEVKADPVAYEAAAVDALSKTNAALVGKMKSLK